MKRRLLLVLLLLVGGAIVNVAVAWGGSLMTDRAAIRGRFVDCRDKVNARAAAMWNRHAMDGWPDSPWSQANWYGILASGSHFYAGANMGSWVVPIHATEAQLREIYDESGTFEVEQINYGFPLGSLRLERWKGDPMRSDLFPTSDGHDGWSFGDVAIPRRVLVLRTAINTVFYAVVLCLLFAGPFVLRRRRRIRRGLCPKCAYDLRGSVDAAACPECGAIVEKALA